MSAWRAGSHGKQELPISLREEWQALKDELSRCHSTPAIQFVFQLRETGFRSRRAEAASRSFEINHSGQTSYWLVLLEH